MITPVSTFAVVDFVSGNVVGVGFAVLHKVLSGTGATLVETRARVLGKLEKVDRGDVEALGV